MKFDAKQVQRVEEVTASNGRKYRRIMVRMTPEQRKEYRKLVEAEEKAGPPRRTVSKQRLETVFSPEETQVLDVVDQYATEHGLPNRGAVVRVALSRLLGLEIAIPHHGWQPGRARAIKKGRVKSAKPTKPSRKS